MAGDIKRQVIPYWQLGVVPEYGFCELMNGLDTL